MKRKLEIDTMMVEQCVLLLCQEEDKVTDYNVSVNPRCFIVCFKNH